MSFGGFKDWEEFKKHCTTIDTDRGDRCFNECEFFVACKLGLCKTFNYGTDDQQFKNTFENLNIYYRKQKLEKLLSS